MVLPHPALHQTNHSIPPRPACPLTCELALLQKALQEGRVREKHLLQPLSTHVEDRIDEEPAREIRKQGGQVSWETEQGLEGVDPAPPHSQPSGWRGAPIMCARVVLGIEPRASLMSYSYTPSPLKIFYFDIGCC